MSGVDLRRRQYTRASRQIKVELLFATLFQRHGICFSIYYSSISAVWENDAERRRMVRPCSNHDRVLDVLALDSH